MADAARLLDTSIFIDFLRGSETAKAWIGGFSTGELAYSVVTAAELLAGCRNRREQGIVEKELMLYPVVHISGAISQTALDWYRQFHLSHGIGFLDCLIGASAHHYGLTICTLNDKHFHPLPEVKVERPY
ncbi:type II toxin-antitoxin system VapC family toxin [Chloroflexi bacterium CFX6]|nr:type II toxin-antitoxin system VapC family toxin [Chloroflexi bacterium CFX6]